MKIKLLSNKIKLLPLTFLLCIMSAASFADHPPKHDKDCGPGFMITDSLDILFKNVNQPGSPSFFLFDTGPELVAPDGIKIVPAGSHWVAEGTVYPGNSVSYHSTSGYVAPANSIGKWICQGGISLSSPIIEIGAYNPPNGTIGKELGLGNFVLTLNSDPKNFTQIFGSYTARTIDVGQGPHVSNRFELKNISGGTGANLGIKDVVIEATTYNDAQGSILLKYKLSSNICVPNN